MSVEENKKVARRLIEEAINQRHPDVIHEVTTPEWTKHNNLKSETITPSDYRDYIAAALKAFPDIQYGITNILGEGDYVAVFLTVTGTFKNKYRDREPTGKTETFAGCELFRFVDGKIAEEWLVYDSATREKLLGIYGKSD